LKRCLFMPLSNSGVSKGESAIGVLITDGAPGRAAMRECGLDVELTSYHLIWLMTKSGTSDHDGIKFRTEPSHY
jgi:hypothetical protein